MPRSIGMRGSIGVREVEELADLEDFLDVGARVHVLEDMAHDALGAGLSGFGQDAEIQQLIARFHAPGGLA